MNSFTLKIRNFYRIHFKPAENEINFESFTRVSIFFLRILCLDFNSLSKNSNLKMKLNHYRKKFFNLLCLIFLFLGVIQLIAYGMVHFVNFSTVMYALSDASAVIQIAIKFSTIVWHKDEIQVIFKEFKTLLDRRNSMNDGFRMKKYFVGYFRFIKIYTGTFISGNLLFAILWFPYLFRGRFIYLVKYWFPFDVYQSNMFPVVHLYTSFMGFLLFNSFVGSDLLIYALLTVTSMEFDFLKVSCKLLNIKSNEERKARIASIAERHNKLIELSDKLQKIFELSFLYGFGLSSFSLCMTSFHLLTTDKNLMQDIFDILCIVMIIGQVGLLCYFGQKLSDSSIRVAEGIYECGWLDIDDNSFKKQIVLVMLRSQRPIQLHAMGFANISLATFTTVNYCILNYL